MAGSKFADILKFLDEVESSDDTASVAASLDASRCGSELAENVVTGLKRQIQQLREQLQQQESKSAALKRKLNDAKAKDSDRVQQLQQDLSHQKDEFEAHAARNLQFINSLLSDKETLNAKVSALSQDLKALEEKHETKVREIEERHVAMGSSQKAQWANLEKRKRTAWQEEQTKKIKEDTLKSLEPDIAKLLNRHRAEKQRLEHEHDEEVRRRDALVAQKEREMVELKRWLEEVKAQELGRKDAILEEKDRDLLDQRSRMAREYEQSLAREREFFQQQTKEQCERFERQLEYQRQQLREAKEREEEATFKWQQELSSEKARLKTEKSSQVMQFEEQLREKMELEYQAKHKALKEEVQQEGARELAALKQQLEKERDAEIEMVIGKLEDTVVESQKASEASEKAWKEKYARVLQEKEALSAREEQLQDEVARLTATLLQRQTETEACQKALQEAKEDHEFALKELQTKTAYQLQQVDDLWSAKYAKRIQDQTEAIDRQATRASELQRELDEAAQRHRQAHEEARQQHEVELEQLRVRVQQALGKKDTTIQELQAALQKVEARNRQMEDVLLEQSNKA